MGPRFLIDSNIAIYFRAAKLPDAAKDFVQKALESDSCSLSVISKMEMLGWNFADKHEEQAAVRFVSDLNLLNLTSETVDKTIEIRRKLPKTKLPDAIIAATALVHGLALLTRNTADFSKIEGLDLVNPFDL